jgi:MoaA/NifB/PqqE/SkfB family radical SAM enzyme
MQTYKRLKKLFNLYSGQLDTLILFVTTRCNCRCEHCFYWKQLNQDEDIDLSSIEKISKSSASFRTLMLSGGEPFLRNDLVDIADCFRQNADIGTFAVPTNGYNTRKIVEAVAAFSEKVSDVLVKINLSLDGPQDIHDLMRGREGVYRKAMQTLDELITLRGSRPNLEVNVTTVVCAANFEMMPDFVRQVNAMAIDRHNIEIIRGEAKNPEYNLNREKVVDAYNHAIQASRKKGAAEANPLLRHISVGNRLIEGDIKNRCLAAECDWHVPCVAGKSICVIEPGGELKACELRPAVVRLQDYDFNLSMALNSEEMRIERRRIKQEKCYCTHGCFLSVSLQRSPTHTFIRSPLKSIASGYGKPEKS